VERVSEAPSTFEYSAAARLVRGVYLPVTLTVEDRTTSLDDQDERITIALHF